MDFEQLKFPHIKYISEIQSKSKEERTLYYLGGEPDENNSRLTIGKEYELRTASFSESPDVDRISVWICSCQPYLEVNGWHLITIFLASDDKDKGKVCQVNFKNFGTFADLRNKKIEKILN